jgi:hypothetical protein
MAIKLYDAQDHEYEIEDKLVLTNDVTLPGDFNPHNTRLWIIGDTCGNFGVTLGAVWAQHEQDALDELVDQGMGYALLVSDEDLAKLTDEEREDLATIGNLSEYADLSNTWLREIVFKPSRDWKIMCKFAEARGMQADNLDF